ncbi:MAG: endonuclease III [Candidatus Micrarchaeaceae archaeon]
MMAFVLLDSSKARIAIEGLEAKYPNACYYLNFSTPIELFVAAILSAQTRDEVVNSVTPQLFKKYRTAADYANADLDELIKFVKRVSFAGNKAKNIISACRIIEQKYNGKVPDRMEQLLELPGIGRKTANTVLINAYNKVEGIPVDTWVIKLSGRIGLSKSKDPEEIERDLMRVADKKYWKNIAYVLKAHGKKVCQSQVPLCSKCFLAGICPKNNVTKQG